MTRTVYSDSVRLANGAVAANVLITFTPPTNTTKEDATILSIPVRLYTDALGAFSVELEDDLPGLWTCKLPDATVFTFALPQGGVVSLETLKVSTEQPTPLPSTIDTINEKITEHAEVEASSGTLGHVDYSSSAFETAVASLVGDLGGDKTYRHVQSVASATWIVTHNLGKYPAVQVVDTTKRGVIGDVRYVSNNVIEVLFGAAFAGEAYVN